MTRDGPPVGDGGSWYPGRPPARGRGRRTTWRSRGRPCPPASSRALISPHAGLRYSGPVAAYGYALLRDRPPRTVVLVGPSHRVAFEGVGVFARGAFETPLGRAADRRGRWPQALVAAAPRPCTRTSRAARARALARDAAPFLQHLVPELRIVPLLMGTQTRDEVDALAAALGAALGGPRRPAGRLQRPQPLPSGGRARATWTRPSSATWPTSRPSGSWTGSSAGATTPAAAGPWWR